jgi:hypothetical protein
MIFKKNAHSEALETRDMLSGETLRREAFPWLWTRTLSTF